MVNVALASTTTASCQQLLKFSTHNLSSATWQSHKLDNNYLRLLHTERWDSFTSRWHRDIDDDDDGQVPNWNGQKGKRVLPLESNKRGIDCSGPENYRRDQGATCSCSQANDSSCRQCAECLQGNVQKICQSKRKDDSSEKFWSQAVENAKEMGALKRIWMSLDVGDDDVKACIDIHLIPKSHFLPQTIRQLIYDFHRVIPWIKRWHKEVTKLFYTRKQYMALKKAEGRSREAFK